MALYPAVHLLCSCHGPAHLILVLQAGGWGPSPRRVSHASVCSRWSAVKRFEVRPKGWSVMAGLSGSL